MNGTSTGAPRRIIEAGASAKAASVERLGELDAVAVRVEDVHEPHLPGELDHDAYLDVVAAQPIGLRLHVVDVDGRDPAFGIRLALGQRDVHRAALELGPAVVPVDEGLVETQDPLEEVASPVEVANEVPDARAPDRHLRPEHTEASRECGPCRSAAPAMESQDAAAAIDHDGV